MTRSYDKPWLIRWVDLLQHLNLKPIEQSAGLALAYFADAQGKADDFTWAEFGERAGIQPNTARRMWRDSELIALGLVIKKDRKIGNVIAMPTFTIDLNSPSLQG